MELTEFLRELSVGELQDLAGELNLRTQGKKALLVARIRRKLANPFDVLPLLKNDALKAYARGAQLKTSGTKDELIASLIRGHVLEADESQLCEFIIGQGISDLAIRLDLAKTLRRASSVSKVTGVLRHSGDSKERGKARQLTKSGSEVSVSTLVTLLVEGKEEEVRAAAIALEGSMELAGRSDAVHRALLAHREDLRARKGEIEATMGSAWRDASQLYAVLQPLWKVDEPPMPEPTVKLVEASAEPSAEVVMDHDAHTVHETHAAHEKHEVHELHTAPEAPKVPESVAVEGGQELVLADLKKIERETVEIDVEVPAAPKTLEDRMEVVHPPSEEPVVAPAALSATVPAVDMADRLEIHVHEPALAISPVHEEVVEHAVVVPHPTGMAWHSSEPHAAGHSRGSTVMDFLRQEVEASPERVAKALLHIAGHRDLVLKKRMKIKRDLARVARTPGEGEKRAILRHSVEGYGPLVVAALHSQLKRGG